MQCVHESNLSLLLGPLHPHSRATINLSRQISHRIPIPGSIFDNFTHRPHNLCVTARTLSFPSPEFSFMRFFVLLRFQRRQLEEAHSS
ncbi:hypothetical protein VNO77_32639 [Canavalia gladiata]|uniref:Uncharacterized protein n=1 Tax=Canavalia gladiata TaxID=3824 RepID=A0AAN9Q567_CANGL